ncbi:hypothetical protein HUJ05_001261 [Dendroctonus ponderosae]|nr:hypothetical protein HUJ05_001261 [Dendroctonus ponderosae]
MKNPIEEIGILHRSNVHIKNKDKLNEILNNIARGGLRKLQVVSDFDKTITKQHEDGIPHLSSFAMFSRIRSAAEDETYQATVKKLRQKYYPIELDPHIPVKDKIKHMEDWWNLSEKAIRNGCKEFFRDLNDSNVPALVFSAGCGDIVAAVLKHAGVYLPNVKVISNFLKFNEDGTIMGFKDKIIHVFNKNEYAVKNTDFYGEVADRENAIVLGDSLGDAAMTQGMEHCQNALKIGFLYEQIEDSLPQYLDTFDIVLVDDQTMDVPRAIFDYIRDAAR